MQSASATCSSCPGARRRTSAWRWLAGTTRPRRLARCTRTSRRYWRPLAPVLRMCWVSPPISPISRTVTRWSPSGVSSSARRARPVPRSQSVSWRCRARGSRSRPSPAFRVATERVRRPWEERRPMEEWLERAREDFPYLNGRIYLNAAGAGLAWRGQTAAASRYYEGAARMGADGQLLWEEQGARTRERVARLLKVPFEDVGFYRNTSEVINLAANSIVWQAGDEVVVAKDDFPSVQWPWLKAEQAGGKVIRVDPVAEDLREQQLLEALSPRTRVLAVSHVHTVTGTRLDLARLGRACREVGA